MSAVLEKEQAALTAAEGKLKKLLAAVKKFFSKEFLWVLLILLMGLPLALIMTYVLETYASEEVLSALTTLLEDSPLYIGCYVTSLGGIYFTRMVVGAIKTLITKPES